MSPPNLLAWVQHHMEMGGVKRGPGGPLNVPALGVCPPPQVGQGRGDH